MESVLEEFHVKCNYETHHKSLDRFVNFHVNLHCCVLVLLFIDNRHFNMN